MSQALTIPQEWMIPAGFELSEDSIDPVWFGAGFEHSFAAWDPSGTTITVVSGDNSHTMTVEEAREMKRQIEGVLALIQTAEGDRNA